MSDDVLRSAPRCVLAFAGERGPLVSPVAFWSDGVSLWMTTSASSVKVERLGARGGPTAGRSQEAACAVYVPAPDGAAPGLAVEGTARVFSVEDPVGLLAHGATISAAMAALAVKNAASLAGYAMDLPRTPLRWLPTNRVVIRVRMDRLQSARPPEPGPGIAPALPGVVPPDVRRALAGQRRVVVAIQGAEGLKVRPAVLGAGFSLDFGPGVTVVPGVRAAVALDADPRKRPSEVIGLALHGTLVDDAPSPDAPSLDAPPPDVPAPDVPAPDVPAGGVTPGELSIGGVGPEGTRLEAERATWWSGFDVSGARIPAKPAGGIVLPD